MYPLVMVAGSTESQPFHDRYPCYIEISPLICSVLKSFADFTGKHLRWCLLQLFKKETPKQMFSC